MTGNEMSPEARGGMERHEYDVASSERGRIAVTSAAIAQIVGLAAAQSYGVVGLAGRSRWSRLLPWGIKKGVDVDRRADGLVIELRVIVEHGLRRSDLGRWLRQTRDPDRGNEHGKGTKKRRPHAPPVCRCRGEVSTVYTWMMSPFRE